jgi:hypothetical protein
MKSLLSRLAREVKVVRVSGIESGFRGCGLRRSPGSAVLRRAAFPPSDFQDSGARGISPALQSRVGDGFSPSSRHGVCGYSGGASRVPAKPAKRIAPGEQTIEQSVAANVAPTFRWAFPVAHALACAATIRCLQHERQVISSPRRARKFTRGRPAGPISTSSGASKTCSSKSL